MSPSAPETPKDAWTSEVSLSIPSSDGASNSQPTQAEKPKKPEPHPEIYDEVAVDPSPPKQKERQQQQVAAY